MSKYSRRIDIAHLAAYAEDPRSYCYYKGKPRSLHKKEGRKKKHRWFPLRSRFSQILLLISSLLLILSGGSLWILLG